MTLATITSKYPEFVFDQLMDMLAGSQQYHKNHFDLVLQEMLIKLYPRTQYKQKASDLESVLKQFGDDTLLAQTSIKYDIGHDLIWPGEPPIPQVFDTNYCTLEYHFTWNKNIFYGPPAILIVNFRHDHEWEYVVPHFFTPNIHTDDDIRTFSTLSELIIEMMTENNLYRQTHQI